MGPFLVGLTKNSRTAMCLHSVSNHGRSSLSSMVDVSHFPSWCWSSHTPKCCNDEFAMCVGSDPSYLNIDIARHHACAALNTVMQARLVWPERSNSSTSSKSISIVTVACMFAIEPMRSATGSRRRCVFCPGRYVMFPVPKYAQLLTIAVATRSRCIYRCWLRAAV